MTSNVTRHFQEALADLERNRDPEPLIALFGEDATLGNTASHAPLTGRDGARQFWTSYRSSFGEMESRFRSVIKADSQCALEWTTRGTTVDGAPIEYEGVSVMEYDGDRIVRFHAYFDPSALGAQMLRS